MTKNIRQAVQFATRKDAALAANVIGWPRKDASPIEIMGFKLWSLMDDQCNYLTRDEFDALVTARATALTPRVN